MTIRYNKSGLKHGKWASTPTHLVRVIQSQFFVVLSNRYIYNNVTEFKGDDIVGNIVKDDDNLVRQMWAEAWKMGLYSNFTNDDTACELLET